MSTDPLDQRLAFLHEMDGLKTVLRQSPLLDGSRRENSAEHSWHLALYALLLHDVARSPVDPARVIRMLLVQDVVEVDAGDTPMHGGVSAREQAEREARAAERLFGILPRPEGDALLALWREFEAGETADAAFAKALDRAQPLMANVLTGGGTWVAHRLTLDQVLARYGPTIANGSPRLWAACEALVRSHFATPSDPSPSRAWPRRPPSRYDPAMTFDPQPTLEGRLLTLRPLRAEDWTDLFAVAADPLIWEQHPEPDRCREDVFRAFFAAALASGGALAAVDVQSGRIVGSSRFHGYDEGRSEVEVGWSFLARSHWGGAYNGEMKRLMLEHAFRFVKSVVFLVGPRNLRSRRAIEKVGGVLVGPGFERGHECVVYRISRESWPGSAAGAGGNRKGETP